MKDKGLLYILILIVLVIGVAYMIKGLAKAPVWILALVILAAYLLYRYKGKKLP